MTIQEIKNAVDQGLTVHWASLAYKVVKDKNGDYLIKCSNGSCIGLTNVKGDKLNGEEKDFFINQFES